MFGNPAHGRPVTTFGGVSLDNPRSLWVATSSPGIAAAQPSFLSPILFGGSFLSVVVVVTAFARKAAKPHSWTAVIAVFTVAFGLGQCIGPILSGALPDGPSGVRGYERRVRGSRA